MNKNRYTGCLDRISGKLGGWLEKLHRTMKISQAQVFEYNFSHFLDKATESITGFLHVLPGAWSSYR